MAKIIYIAKPIKFHYLYHPESTCPDIIRNASCQPRQNLQVQNMLRMLEPEACNHSNDAYDPWLELESHHGSY
jgi:hypothetical protein